MQYSRNEIESNPEDKNDEMDLGYDTPGQEVIQNSEALRSLLNTNSREKSGITIETARLITSETTKQDSRKRNELKEDLSTQILNSKNLAISGKVLPAIQNTIGSQMARFEGNVEHKSSRLNKTADLRSPKKTRENLPDSNLNSCDKRNLTPYMDNMVKKQDAR